MTTTVERILQSAEAQARTGGYNSFSFRGISKAVGIKSSSIHYHFPTKTDLAAALARRYRQRFAEHLGLIDASKGGLKEKLAAYIDLFRHALSVDKKMCLCGIFAAEIEYLPKLVQIETRKFFEQNLSWLKGLLQHHQIEGADSIAVQLLAALEGGLLMARTFESDKYFDKATQFAKDGFLTSPSNADGKD